MRYILLILFIVNTFSCKKVADNSEKTEQPVTKTLVNEQKITTHLNNLAVIYFIPKDLEPLPGWEKRLSDIMIYAQDWYKNGMEAAGYGKKTFGLRADKTTGAVEIILVRGTKNKNDYGLDADGYMQEINAYLAANPSKKDSQHILVFTPVYEYDSNNIEGPQPIDGKQPFYGFLTGTPRYCFAMDNRYMDMELKGLLNPGRNNFAKWVGGMMHEIGHVFGAPHDMQLASQNIWPGAAFVEPIMRYSNVFLEVRPCNITASEAAIFDVCEVFNNEAKTYYGSVNSNITKIYGNYDAALNSIIVSGKYTSTGNVKKILYYHDPNENNEGVGLNRDYNALSWASSPIGIDSFRVVVPVNEFTFKSDGMQYELKVKLVHDNGTINEKIYPYYFQGGVPVINISTKKELSKTGWKVVDFSSEETQAEQDLASLVIDGSSTTFWHSKYTDPAASFPHFITIDLGASVSAKGLSYIHRAGGYRGVKDFEIQVSSDGKTYRSLGNKTAAISSDVAQYFDFSSTESFKYLKIIAKNAWDKTQFAAIAEIGLY